MIRLACRGFITVIVGLPVVAGGAALLCLGVFARAFEWVWEKAEM